MDFADRYFQLTNQNPYIQSVIRPTGTLVKKIPFTYDAVIGTAAVPLTLANGQISTYLSTLSDSDFVLTSISACMNQTANSDMKSNRNVSLQVLDTSTGKTFFSAAGVVSLVAGGGGFPLIGAAPRVIRPNTVLQLFGQNRDTTTDYYQMFVSLNGSRLFYDS
jgi:hypothetical protein